MSEHNVLYIVEGSSEKRLLSRLWSRFEPDNVYDVYEYNTNIHVLIGLLFEDGELDEDLELVRTLRSNERDESKKETLKKKFEYVYMIFDFDPQDDRVDYERIAKMMDFFNDPAGNGRLYLNYPMIESYRHVSSLNDAEFKDKKVTLALLKEGRYKQLVEEESPAELKQLNGYTEETFSELIRMHLRKRHYIISGEYAPLRYDDIVNDPDSQLLMEQVRCLNTEGMLFVINTCIFTIAEHMPSRFVEEKKLS